MCKWVCSVDGDVMASPLSIVSLHMVHILGAWLNWRHATAVMMRLSLTGWVIEVYVGKCDYADDL